MRKQNIFHLFSKKISHFFILYTKNIIFAIGFKTKEEKMAFIYQ